MSFDVNPCHYWLLGCMEYACCRKCIKPKKVATTRITIDGAPASVSVERRSAYSARGALTPSQKIHSSPPINGRVQSPRVSRSTGTDEERSLSPAESKSTPILSASHLTVPGATSPIKNPETASEPIPTLESRPTFTPPASPNHFNASEVTAITINPGMAPTLEESRTTPQFSTTLTPPMAASRKESAFIPPKPTGISKESIIAERKSGGVPTTHRITAPTGGKDDWRKLLKPKTPTNTQ